MNIDERLDRLTERHEALSHFVELLTRDLADFKTTTAEAIGGLKDSVATLKESMGIQQQTVNNLTVAVQGLLEITRSHEHRIERLEGRGGPKVQ